MELSTHTGDWEHSRSDEIRITRRANKLARKYFGLNTAESIGPNSVSRQLVYDNRLRVGNQLRIPYS